MPRQNLLEYTKSLIDPNTGLTGNPQDTGNPDFSNIRLPKPDPRITGLTSSNQPMFGYDAREYEPYMSTVNRQYMDIDEIRAQAQDWKFAKGLSKLAPLIATKFAQGVGYVGGAIAAAPTAIHGALTGNQAEMNKAASIALDNFFVDWMSTAEEYVKEEGFFGEIYKTNQYKNGDFFDKITTSEFWAEDFIDGLAFAASAFIPGGIASKAG